MDIELRARIGEPESDLAKEQGCTCDLSKEECLVHGNVVAFVVEKTILGKKRLIDFKHPNSYIVVPMKKEAVFFSTISGATREWLNAHPLIETRMLVKSGKDCFRLLEREEALERGKVVRQLELEVAGM